MEGASSGATSSPACNLVKTEGGGKARAPCGGPAGGGGGGGVSIVSGGDFEWGFPLTGIGSSLTGSFSSLSSSSSSSSASSLAEPPPTQLTALVEGVMGVMTSVKTLGRHPVLATVLWLLGGSVEDNDKENSSGNNRSSATSSLSSGSSSNYHRQQQRQQAQYHRKQQQQHHHHHPDDHSNGGGGRSGGGSPDHVRRLRWNARRGAPGSSPPEANANDRIVYYLDRPTGGWRNPGESNESLGSSGQGWGHGLVHEDSQMIYPETIAVSEKITHMDRLEQDDLDASPPSAGAGSGSGSGSGGTRPHHHRHFDHHNNAGVGYLPHLQQHHDIGLGQSGGSGGGGGGHDDVSPQWGWYVTLTPPKPAEFKKDGAGQAAASAGGAAGAAAAGSKRSLRPGMTTVSSSS